MKFFVKKSDMFHTVISQRVTAKFASVCVEHNILSAFGNLESVAFETLCGIEIVDEKQIFSHESENLVFVIVTYFHNLWFSEMLFAFNELEHFLIKITEEMET